MKDRKKPEKFLLPHGMPSDKREFAFSSYRALKVQFHLDDEVIEVLKIRGHDGDECELHQTPLSPRGDGDMPGRTLLAWTACTPTILIVYEPHGSVLQMEMRA